MAGTCAGRARLSSGKPMLGPLASLRITDRAACPPDPPRFPAPCSTSFADDTRGRLQCAHSVEHLVLFDDHPRDGEHDERRRHHKRHPLERTGDPLEASGPVAQLDEASWAHDRTAAPSAA